MTDSFLIADAEVRDFIRDTSRRSFGTFDDRPDDFASEGLNVRFDRLALRLFQLQYDTLPTYRIWCEQRRRTPGTFKTWKDFPSVPTAAFKEVELSCIPAVQRIAVFHSSGTTASQPSRHFHSQNSLSLYEESLRPWFRRHSIDLPTPYGLGDRCSFVSLTPPVEAIPQSSLGYMLGCVATEFSGVSPVFGGRLGKEGWELDLEKIEETLLSAVAESRPVILVGTAFNFVHLMDHLEARGLRYTLPMGSRIMETGGYKGRSRSVSRGKLREMISARFGVGERGILTEYGMAELSSQAYDIGEGFRFPAWARVRIVSPETGLEVEDGVAGLIQIVDLANVWSVAALETQDLGIRRGATFELLGRANAAEARGCSLLMG